MASVPILSISWYIEVGSVGSDLVREAGRGGGTSSSDLDLFNHHILTKIATRGAFFRQVV